MFNLPNKHAGNLLLQPTSIPYARYTIFVCLANIELAFGKQGFAKALSLIEELLEETSPLTRVDIPEVLRWKGQVLFALNHLDEAQQALTEARLLAEKTSSNLHLWPILANLSEVNLKLGNHNEAEANQKQARAIIQQIAESLREVGLSESFLHQPRILKLTG